MGIKHVSFEFRFLILDDLYTKPTLQCDANYKCKCIDDESMIYIDCDSKFLIKYIIYLLTFRAFSP